MKTVLIIDDDRELCGKLRAHLERYPSLAIQCAYNGLEAMGLLETIPFDLVITDLHMPEMSGFALIAYMSRHQKGIPVIIVTAFGSAEVESRLRERGILTCVEKPFEPEAIAHHIFEQLRFADGGGLRGISVAAMLQLLELERKTCTLRIHSKGRQASLHLLYGRLIDAVEGAQHGEAAAREAIRWEDEVSMDVEDQCQSTGRTIDTELRFIIMDSLRLKDEGAEDLDGSLDENLFTAESLEPGSVPDVGADADPSLGVLSDTATGQLRGFLGTLEEVRGYQASVIMDTLGHVIVSHSNDPSLDLGLTCRSFSETLRSVERASATLELDRCDESVFRTRKGIVLAENLRPDPAVPSRAHLLVLFSEEISEGMMKMRTRRVVPEVLATLFRRQQ